MNFFLREVSGLERLKMTIALRCSLSKELMEERGQQEGTCPQRQKQHMQRPWLGIGEQASGERTKVNRGEQPGPCDDGKAPLTSGMGGKEFSVPYSGSSSYSDCINWRGSPLRLKHLLGSHWLRCR